jgi:hypothetical protein
MDKCPKCGHWTYSINTQYKILECVRVECCHQEPVDIEKRLSNHNVLPNLAKSIRLREQDGVF